MCWLQQIHRPVFPLSLEFHVHVRPFVESFHWQTRLKTCFCWVTFLLTETAEDFESGDGLRLGQGVVELWEGMLAAVVGSHYVLLKPEWCKKFVSLHTSYLLVMLSLDTIVIKELN